MSHFTSQLTPNARPRDSQASSESSSLEQRLFSEQHPAFAGAMMMNNDYSRGLAAGFPPPGANNAWMTMQQQQQNDMDLLALMRARSRLQQQVNAGGPVDVKALQAAGMGPGAGLPPKKRAFEKDFTKAEQQQPVMKPSKRRKKGDKPSDMPRRALSAYNIFFSEQREKILKELSGGDDAPAAAADDDKGDDNNTKKDDKDNGEEEKKERPSVLDRTFFPTRKKRPHRKVHGKIGLVDLARTVSQRWKDLPEKERKYYQDLAKQDKERHKKAMVEYQDKKAAEAAKSMVSFKTPANEDEDEEEATAQETAGQRQASAAPSLPVQHHQDYNRNMQPSEAVEEGMRLALMQQEYQRRLMAEQIMTLRLREQQQQNQLMMFPSGNMNMQMSMPMQGYPMMNMNMMDQQQQQRGGNNPNNPQNNSGNGGGFHQF